MEITDAELRRNHDFVMAFEALRRQGGHREMHDAALQEVAGATGLSYETLRVCRHVRNALAHGDEVNRDALERHHAVLATAVQPSIVPSRAVEPPTQLGEAPRAYRVHAWGDVRLEHEMVANGFVSVGGDEIGDLTGVDDPEYIRAWLERTMPGRSRQAVNLFVGYWRRFLWEARVGDLVVLPPRGKAVAIGELVGPYHYVEHDEARARHRRAVHWIAASVPRKAFGLDLTAILQGRHTVQEFKGPDAAHRLRVLADTGIDPLQHRTL